MQRAAPTQRRRGPNDPFCPQSVHRASAADPPASGGSPPKLARGLDMVVASGRIPQDVVVLGLDYGRAAGVHSAGRPGSRQDLEGAEEAAGETVRSASQDPGWRHIARALAAIVTTTRTGRSSPGRRPNRGRRQATGRESGRKAGGRREVGRPADARARGDRPYEQVLGVSGVRRPRSPRQHHATAPRRGTRKRTARPPQVPKKMIDRPGRDQKGAGNESSWCERDPREREDRDPRDRDPRHVAGRSRNQGDPRHG